MHTESSAVSSQLATVDAKWFGQELNKFIKLVKKMRPWEKENRTCWLLVSIM